MTLPKLVKFGYGVGHFTNDLCAAMWFTYVLIFYDMVLGFSTFYSGLIMLTGQIADAVSTPFIGILCDRGPTIWKIDLRRRKNWYASGSIMLFLTYPFLFFDCLNCYHANMILKFVYYSVFVVLFQIGWAAVQISHLAMATDLTSDEHERTVLMSLRNTFTVLSNLIVYIMTFLLFHLNPSGNDKNTKLNENDDWKFQIVALSTLGLGTVGNILFYFIVQENTNRLMEMDTGRGNRASYKSLFCKFSLYQISLIYMGTRIFVNVTQALLPLYLNITLLLDKSAIASLPFIMYTSSFIASLVAATINETMGRKFTFFIGVTMSCGASIWIKIDTSHFYKQYFIYVVTILLGFASSLLLVTALAVTLDYIGDDINNGAFLFGIISFDKFTCGIVLMAIQGCKQYFGPMYYRDVFAYIGTGSTIIGLICIITLKLNRTMVDNIAENPRTSVTGKNAAEQLEKPQRGGPLSKVRLRVA